MDLCQGFDLSKWHCCTVGMLYRANRNYKNPLTNIYVSHCLNMLGSIGPLRDVVRNFNRINRTNSSKLCSADTINADETFFRLIERKGLLVLRV